MRMEIVNDISVQIDAIESAEAILVMASTADGMACKTLIEAAIYIIQHAVPTARGYLDAACRA